MIKAIVTDLDDTLLRHDKTVSEFTIHVLQNCRAKGIKTVFATARGTSAKDLIPLELFDGSVMLNGALAIADSRTVYRKYISKDIYRDFLIKVDGLNINAAAEIGGVHYANFDVASRWKREYVLTDFSDIEQESEKLYTVIDSPEQVKNIVELLPSELYIHFTRDGLALIMHREATKLKALSQVLHFWDISLSDTVAFGDDINDREMLQHCGIGVAMSNALDEIKEISDDICGDCDDDGVANWLSKHIL